MANRQVANELEAYGVRSPLAMTEVRQGPFFLDVSFLDNVTTDTDLTATGVIGEDAQLEAMGAGSSQPAIFLVVTAVQWRIAMLAETAQIQLAMLRSAYIKHQPAGAMERRIPLGDAIVTAPFVSASGTDAQYFSIHRRPYKLKNPAAISLRRDQLNLSLTTAVNTAAGNLEGTLVLYGYAMPDSDNYSALPCASAKQAGEFSSGGLRAFRTLV